MAVFIFLYRRNLHKHSWAQSGHTFLFVRRRKEFLFIERERVECSSLILCQSLNVCLLISEIN